jgi:hypothetical protein
MKNDDSQQTNSSTSFASLVYQQFIYLFEEALPGNA